MPNDSSSQGVSIQKILEIAKRRKFLIAIPAFLVTLAFGAVAYYLPNQYRAQVIIAAESQGSSLGLPFNIQEQLWAVRVGLFSRPALEKVIQEFELQAGGGPVTEKAIEEFKSRIKIRVEGNEACSVALELENPRQVADVMNRLAELFVQQTAAARSQLLSATSGAVETELEELRKTLFEQNEKIKAYKGRTVNELPEYQSANLNALTLLQEQIHTKTTSIANDQAERARVVREMKDLEQQGAPNSVDPGSKTAAQLRLEELRLQIPALRARYTEQHPERASAEHELKELEELVSRSGRNPGSQPSALSVRYVQLTAELEGIDQRLRSDRQTVISLTDQMRDYQRRVEATPGHERDLAALMRDYEAAQAQYQSLLVRQSQTQLSGRMDQLDRGIAFKIAESARTPAKPSSPHRERIAAMGVLLGLGLGVLLAFAKEQLNTKFKDALELQNLTDLPVVTEVPSIRAKSKPGRLVTVSDPQCVAAEQYSMLAMKIRQSCGDAESVVLALTSATGGEGKTLTSVNLSVALSRGNSGKVLLLDADLRRPSVHEYLDLHPVKGRGFGNLLQKPDEDFHRMTWNKNGIHVIPGTPEIANPVGVLASPKTRTLLNRLRREYKFIVLDSPPIIPTADGHILAGLADRAILVVRARSTPRDLFKHALENFDASNVLGIVLNDVDFEHSYYSSAYEYYQNHYIKG